MVIPISVIAGLVFFPIAFVTLMYGAYSGIRMWDRRTEHRAVGLPEKQRRDGLGVFFGIVQSIALLLLVLGLFSEFEPFLAFGVVWALGLAISLFDHFEYRSDRKKYVAANEDVESIVG